MMLDDQIEERIRECGRAAGEAFSEAAHARPADVDGDAYADEITRIFLEGKAEGIQGYWRRFS